MALRSDPAGWGGLFRVRSGAFDQPTLSLSTHDAAQTRPDCGDLVESCVRNGRIKARLAHSSKDLFSGAVSFVKRGIGPGLKVSGEGAGDAVGLEVFVELAPSGLAAFHGEQVDRGAGRCGLRRHVGGVLRDEDHIRCAQKREIWVGPLVIPDDAGKA